MSSTDDPKVRYEEFFRRRSDDPDSVQVVTTSSSPAGTAGRLACLDRGVGAQRGYIIRQDPPPGQAIIDTDRAIEWEVLSSLHETGKVPMPAPLWLDPTGEEPAAQAS